MKRLEIVRGILAVLHDGHSDIKTSNIIRAVFSLKEGFYSEYLEIEGVKVRIATADWVEHEDSFMGCVNMVDFMDDVPYMYHMTDSYYITLVCERESWIASLRREEPFVSSCDFDLDFDDTDDFPF